MVSGMNRHTLGTLVERRAWLILIAGTALLMALQLAEAPPLWFDEGWILSVARNFVERGHYGQLLAGVHASASMLNVGFPAVLPIALSFKLLGVGAWQGRLPGVLFTIGFLLLIHLLAKRLYGRRVAVCSLAVLALFSTIPVFRVGKQALGEMPMLFYLLVGLAIFSRYPKRPLVILPAAAFFWGLGMMTKLHLVPFLTLALLLLITRALFKRRWLDAGRYSLVLTASLGFFFLFFKIQEVLLNDRMMRLPAVYGITAWVPVWEIRLFSLGVLTVLGIPTLIALFHAAVGHFKKSTSPAEEMGIQAVRFIIVTFLLGWMAWFTLLSNGWQRYLVAPVFLASIFLAVFLHSATNGYSLPYTVKQAALALRLGRSQRRNWAALVALLVVIMGLAGNLRAVRDTFAGADRSAMDVAGYINAHSPPDSLVESYEWEVLFLLNRPYHYPSDEVQVELYRRSIAGQVLDTGYDPLRADPDLLVIGDIGRFWHLYDNALASQRFQLIGKFGRYELYRRR